MQASNGPSGSFLGGRGSEDPSGTPSNTAGNAQSTSSGTSGIASTPPALSAEPSTTSRRALGAGFTAGNAPRSGTQDSASTLATSTSTSSAPYLVAPGSTCPLPSTITVSATLRDASCATFEKTVTSYIMASCPAPSGVFETQTIVESGRTAYITRTRQMTRPVVVTYTTVEGGTTVYRTSLQERTLTPLPTTFPNGSTIERTATQDQVSTIEDGLGYCTSVLERTITIEHTVAHTVGLGGNSPIYATITTSQNGTTAYLTSLIGATIEATPFSISAGIPTVTLTMWNGSTIYRTSIIERTATAIATPVPSDPVTITFTQADDNLNFNGPAPNRTQKPNPDRWRCSILACRIRRLQLYLHISLGDRVQRQKQHGLRAFY